MYNVINIAVKGKGFFKPDFNMVCEKDWAYQTPGRAKFAYYVCLIGSLPFTVVILLLIYGLIYGIVH